MKTLRVLLPLYLTENRKSFNAVAEVFLAQCLGGPYQPVGGDFDGASISVPEGAQHVFGLADAVKAKK
jgi:hypothetical protein